MMHVWHWLCEPFQYQFMRNGLFAVVLVGVTCALLGVHMVLRHMTFAGDALAHTLLPGLVVAYLCNWNLSLGALAAGLVAALAIGWGSRNEELREDSAIGIVFTGMFALGVVLISSVKSFRDFSHMLFGNILGVTQGDLYRMAAVTAFVLGVVVLFHKELELSWVDPTHARIIGLRPDCLRLVVLFLLALAVVIGVQASGVVLVTALLVTPAATASLLTQRMVGMMVLAPVISVLAGAFGLIVSYRWSVSGGGAIVLCCTVAFILASIHSKMQNRLRRPRPSVISSPPSGTTRKNGEIVRGNVSRCSR
jgi:ABC-type Mn2+/Zn2+ transport system permease subunit